MSHRFGSFALASLAGFALAAPLAAGTTRSYHETLPVEPGGRVTFETYKGSLRVSTWSRPEVEVEARVEPDDSCGDGERLVEETKVEIEKRGGGVRIRSDYDAAKRERGWSRFWSCTSLPFVHYVVKLPVSSPVTIDDYKSTIEVKGLAADLDLKTYKGTASVADLDGRLDLETYKGEASVSLVKVAKPVRVQTYKGEVALSLPRGASFDLEADFGRKGRFDSDFDGTSATSRRRRDAEDGVLSSRVNGGGPRISVETYKGDVRLRAR